LHKRRISRRPDISTDLGRSFLFDRVPTNGRNGRSAEGGQEKESKELVGRKNLKTARGDERPLRRRYQGREFRQTKGRSKKNAEEERKQLKGQMFLRTGAADAKVLSRSCLIGLGKGGQRRKKGVPEKKKETKKEGRNPNKVSGTRRMSLSVGLGTDPKKTKDPMQERPRT